MNIFGSFLNKSSMNDLLAKAHEQNDALIVDVRTPSEFSTGHIPGAINIPVDKIEKLTKIAKDTDRPLYLYCASGARSAHAARFMRQKGYTQVENMGGIGGYSGTLER